MTQSELVGPGHFGLAARTRGEPPFHYHWHKSPELLWEDAHSRRCVHRGDRLLTLS